MPGRLDADFQFGRAHPTLRRTERGPMRLLLMGDFGGQAARHAQAAMGLNQRWVHRVDADGLERVLARIAPCVSLTGDAGAAEATLDFATLDDFHPDRVYERIAVFARLRELLDRLLDPARFDQACADVRTQGLAQPAGSATQVDPDTAETDAVTMQRLLGRAPSAVPMPPAQATGGIDALIRGIVAPYILPDMAPLQALYVAAVDEAIGEQMRLLLHAPAFSALERVWRGVQWLVSRLELSEELQLHLLDVTAEELKADLADANGDPSRSDLARLLRGRSDESTGEAAWSLMVGLFSFGPSAEQLGLLAGLGTIASQVGAPFVAAAAQGLFGCDAVSHLHNPQQWLSLTPEDALRWGALRRSPVAPWIGLVAPRLLLRLPYGKATDPTERFPFEEQPAVPLHETLAWGSGSLAVAQLVGQAFTDSGWDLAPGQVQDLADLPAYTFKVNGETQLHACAEAWLGEAAGQALLERGLMPLVSHRERAAVRLLRVQSIAEPPQALAGPWG